MKMTDAQMPRIIPLRLRPEDSTRRWKFTKSWYFYFKPLGITFFIPRGYIVNGASIPSWAQGIFSPVGFLFIGSILHDFFYDKAFYYRLSNFHGKHRGGIKACTKIKITRKTADIYFKRIATYIYPNKKWSAKVAYMALFLGGQIAWNNHRKEDKTYSKPSYPKWNWGLNVY